MQQELFIIIKHTLIGCKYVYYSFLDRSHGMELEEELEALKDNVGVLFSTLEVI